MRTVTIVLWAGFLGCSTRSQSVESAGAPPSAQAVLGALRVHEPIARNLGTSERLVADGTRLRLASSHPGFVPAGAMTGRVSAPTTSGGPLRLESTADPGRFVEIDDPTLRDVGAEVIDGAAVFRDAAPDTDVVVALQPGRIEESRLVRAHAAKSVTRWRLRLGPSLVGARVRDHRVEVLDAEGRVFVESSPVVAFDATGKRYEARLSLTSIANGHVLEAAFDAQSAALPLAIDPVWTLSANMLGPRASHAAVALADNRVMITGGTDGTFALSSTELFNPATGTWSAGPSMLGARGGHFALRLLDNRVLVGGGSLLESEVFNPATNTWTAAGSTGTWHTEKGATLHPTSGKVYVAGSGGYTKVFEVWDPGTNKWSQLADMLVDREGTTLTVLPGGTKILAAGSNNTTKAAELYDIASNTWTLTPTTMVAAHIKPLAFLQGGLVHIVGAGLLHDVFDPVANTWTAGASLSVNREPGYVGGLLPSGKFLIVGGYNSPATTEIWDPTTAKWATATALSSGRFSLAMAPLPSSRFLATGGYGAGVVSTAEIFALLPAATTCTVGGECASGFCVDGVCCDSACNTGPCVACNVTGSMGTCSPVPSGAPHGSRTCAPYASCAAGACATSCTATSACTSASYCSGTACVPRLANGTTCTANDQCTSNACVDGVCCNRACSGQCESCNRTGSLGTCQVQTGAPAPGRAPCPGIGVGGTCGHRCDGTSANCSYPAVTTACSGATCAAGVETHPSFCDGSGKCSDTAKACGAYVCGATACLSSCTGNAQCATGFYCASGACVPVADLGKECSTGGSCSTTYCVDGVCCGSATCDAGSSCANPGKKGKCSKSNGTSCTSDAECGSGSCVDGVCCDGKCDGQCEACDIAGRVGRCFPVSGKPHGSRAACADGGGDTCKAMTCDGAKDTTSCVGFASGPSVECTPATCAAGTATEAAFCDGAGTCRAPSTKSCAPFVCDASGKACRTSCASKDDCSTGNTCQGGVCVPGATCSSDGLSSITKEGSVSCAPYRCRDGNCPTSCGASSDCAAGFACDESGKCVAPQTEESGGCATSTTPSHAGSSLLLFAFAAAVARARRRSRLGL